MLETVWCEWLREVGGGGGGAAQDPFFAWVCAAAAACAVKARGMRGGLQGGGGEVVADPPCGWHGQQAQSLPGSPSHSAGKCVFRAENALAVVA